jgi:hypothetical protein
VYRDHVQCGDGKAVLSGSCFLAGDVYVLADKRLEVRIAGRDLESLAGVVL